MIDFRAALDQRIKLKVAELAESLWNSPSNDHGDYMRRVGVIEGLNAAAAESEDVSKKLNSR